MNREDKLYHPLKKNSLFFISRYGKDSRKVIRVASTPKDVVLNGPWFSLDGKTLFLSVQHPIKQTKDLNNPTST